METIDSSSFGVTERRVEEKPEGCPVDHNVFARQKTARVHELGGLPVEQDAQGTWHVRSFELARAVLRSGSTRQAGFNAELLEKIPQLSRQPILYLEGKEHQQQRKHTARFFTPKAVSTNYRALMERLADQYIADLRRRRKADLSTLSLRMAVRVAAEVVGLTDSRLPGMARRLEAFFEGEPGPFSWRPRALWRFVRNQWRTLAFFFYDVQPAIKARRRQSREDLISHLIAQGYSDLEILTECMTFSAAGMVTTREFISVATWHLLEQPELLTHYLAASENERYALLSEILRLEPVVSHLYRRVAVDLSLEWQDEEIVIPSGALVNLHIYGTNTDESIVGKYPHQLCPDRELQGERIPGEMMSFGDGHHRCPGSYVAIQEADTFLCRLLSIGGLRIIQSPILSWNEMIASYELRKFIVGVV